MTQFYERTTPEPLEGFRRYFIIIIIIIIIIINIPSMFNFSFYSPAHGGKYCIGEWKKYKLCNTQVEGSVQFLKHLRVPRVKTPTKTNNTLEKVRPHLVQQNNQHIMKVLFNSFHLNGLTLGFHPQTQKIKPPCTA